MDNRTTLSIKAKNTLGKTVTTNINHVNPTATNEKLNALATALNALTTNTIASVVKESREVIS